MAERVLFFHVYAENAVYYALQAERERRNRIRRIESPFSLDQPIQGDKRNPKSCVFYAQTGDFVNAVIFSDFMASLLQALRGIANGFLQGYYPEEIMEMERLTKELLVEGVSLLGKCWEYYSAEMEEIA